MLICRKIGIPAILIDLINAKFMEYFELEKCQTHGINCISHEMRGWIIAPSEAVGASHAALTFIYLFLFFNSFRK